jgi:indolepyruvate ferredoxin oxidoreductase, beta subunit
MSDTAVITTRIMLAGVGGQGTILAAKIISEAAAAAGHDVKMSEIHGMSQRGGSVVSHVAFGSQVFSPLPDLKSVDCLVAFEKLEAMRQFSYLKPDGLLIVNDLEIAPMSVLSGLADYPLDGLKQLKDTADNILVLDAAGEARNIGMLQVQNLILIGALSTLPALEKFPWKATIQKSVRAQFSEINLKAFQIGKDLAAAAAGHKENRNPHGF